MFGCAAMFTYLTGFRAAEVRPFHVSGIVAREGCGWSAQSARRANQKCRSCASGRCGCAWSSSAPDRLTGPDASTCSPTAPAGPTLEVAGARAGPTQCLTGSLPSTTRWPGICRRNTLLRREIEGPQKAGGEHEVREDYSVTTHPAYFSLQAIRPAAITTKLRRRDVEAYDFAANANPATTHQHYERRSERRARATG
jgi:hypothetical protein